MKLRKILAGSALSVAFFTISTGSAFAAALERVLQVASGEGSSVTLPTPVPAEPMPDSALPIRAAETPTKTKTPWIMLGLGLVLAVAGVIALWAAFKVGS